MTWRIHTTVHARSQHVADILGLNYKPLGVEESLSFDAKQKHMFAVFTSILLTDKGNALVCEYYNTGNVHQIYTGSITHITASTKASVKRA